MSTKSGEDPPPVRSFYLANAGGGGPGRCNTGSLNGSPNTLLVQTGRQRRAFISQYWPAAQQYVRRPRLPTLAPCTVVDR